MRVASQLQDDAAQRLAAIMIKTGGNRAIAQEAAALTDELYNIARALRPPGMLSGLNGAVRSYVRSLDSRGVDVSLKADGAPTSIEHSRAVGIYRLLEDIIEHAVARGSEPIEIATSTTPSTVEVGVRLGGSVPAGDVFRLSERAALLRGTVRVSNGDGSNIAISIPIEENTGDAGYDPRNTG
jgi:glucose-6-phosphate-specific signal transduction histidine kinase